MTKGLNKLHVGLALSIVLFLALGYWLVKPKLPDLAPNLSFSADVDGTKAWKELIGTKQSAVKEWRLDWKHLPSGTSMLLVAIQPSAVTKSDREYLLKWVQAGNDAIILIVNRKAGRLGRRFEWMVARRGRRVKRVSRVSRVSRTSRIRVPQRFAFRQVMHQRRER